MPTWNGNTSTNFLVGANWDGNVAPGPGSDATVDGSLGNNPTLLGGDSAVVGTVAVSAGELTVTGNLTATNGVFLSNDGIIDITVPGSISGNVDVSGFGFLAINGSLTGNATVTSGSVDIFGTLAGTVALSGGGSRTWARSPARSACRAALCSCFPDRTWRTAKA